MDDEAASAERQHTETIRRVRSLLLLAAKKSIGRNDSAKEREKKEIEFFKRLLVVCDRDHDGCLDLSEVTLMIRTHLKIAERLVSDEQVRDFFVAIDTDGSGLVEFSEFVGFIRLKEPKTKVNDIILTQVKRVLRLAMQRKKMTLSDLERRFVNAQDEGIIDGGVDHTSLGPEEMRRFFRKVLDVNTHEAPDKNLLVAFRSMDEDGGGSLDSEEFLSWMRQAISEETTLCAPRAKDSEYLVPALLGGMRGSLPERLPRTRPGTTCQRGVSQAPFCLSGRDVEPQMRLSMSMPSHSRGPSRRNVLRSKSSSLLCSGMLKTASGPGSPTMRASDSMTSLLSQPLSCADGPLSPKSVGTAPFCLPPLSPSKISSTFEPGQERGVYSPVKGMLTRKDADVLNRIESRLFDAGVDVRGQFNKHG